MRFFLFALPLLSYLYLSGAQTTQITVTSADGTRIWAEATGNIHGAHLILAHGLACTHNAFDPLFSDLKLLTSLYMVRYDTRGHGYSGKPTTPDFYTSDRYADDLTAIIKAFNLVQPFFAGWSLGGAIGADIAANFPHPLPFSGLIWLAGLPYLGDILPKVATREALSFLPGLQETTDASLGLQTRLNFVETLSAFTNEVPPATKSSWVGATAYLPPSIATLVLARTQNATRLLQEGAAGWPLLILAGTADQQINGSATISNMAPLFKNVESHLIPGGGHIIFYDEGPAVSQYILSFILRIKLTNPYP